LIIELWRAWTRQDMDAAACALCVQEFTLQSVYATGKSDQHYDLGVICPSCLAYLGARAPQRFPTIEEYIRALRQYPQPMYESSEDLEAAAVAAGYEDRGELAFHDSLVWDANSAR
jgi:hypothetical protein